MTQALSNKKPPSTTTLSASTVYDTVVEPEIENRQDATPREPASSAVTTLSRASSDHCRLLNSLHINFTRWLGMANGTLKTTKATTFWRNIWFETVAFGPSMKLRDVFSLG